METEKSSVRVRSAEKALGILELFDADRPKLSLQSIVQITGLNRATAYRFCQTLLYLGFLERSGDRDYRPGIKTLLLGHAAFATLELPEIAWPHLEALQEATGETANLAIRDRTEIVYLMRLKSSQIVNIQLYVGSRLPVYCTSMGKAILAHLPADEAEEVISECRFESRTPNTITNAKRLKEELIEVRRDGYAINDEELELGLRGVAAPVFNSVQYPIASINVAVPARTARKEIEKKMAPLVTEAANTITDVLSVVGRRSGEATTQVVHEKHPASSSKTTL